MLLDILFLEYPFSTFKNTKFARIQYLTAYNFLSVNKSYKT